MSGAEDNVVSEGVPVLPRRAAQKAMVCTVLPTQHINSSMKDTSGHHIFTEVLHGNLVFAVTRRLPYLRAGSTQTWT